MKFFGKWKKISCQSLMKFCNKNWATTLGRLVTSFLMELKCKWRASRGKVSLKNCFRTSSHPLTSSKIWVASRAFIKWLWNPFPNQTSISEETCSKMLYSQGETRCLRDSKREFRSSFLISVLRTSKLRCSEEATAVSCHGSGDRYYRPLVHSSRCGWVDKNTRSTEQLWLKENALDGL